MLDTWLQGQRVRIAPNHTQQNFDRSDREREAQLKSNQHQGAVGIQRLNFVSFAEALVPNSRSEHPAHHGESKKQPLPHSVKIPQKLLDERISAPSPVCLSPASHPSALPALARRLVKTTILYYII